MSVTNFKANYQNALLQKLSTEMGMRKSIESQKGQLLILPGPNELKKAVKDTFGDSVKISDHHYSSAVEKARTHAKKLHDRFKNTQKNKTRYNNIVNIAIPRMKGKLPPSFVLEKNMFIVTSFRYSINSIKKTMLKHFEENNLITSKQKAELQKNIHKGHGVKGSAVSQIEIASAVATIPLEFTGPLAKAFQSWALKSDIDPKVRAEVRTIISIHDQLVTPEGDLRDDYVSNVVFQMGSDNIRDAVFEKAVKGAFRDFVSEYSKNLVNEKGSSTLKQKMTKVVLDSFDDKKNIKVTSKSKNAKLKTRHKNTIKGKKQKVAPANIQKGGTTRKVKTAANVSSSPLALIQMFNAKLPDKLAQNMKSPRLNYRTGRFANSVKVVDVSTTQQGFYSFGYSYQKSPYQTFEVGFAQGDPDRDPRSLIDRSMREIAAEFAIGRFYTRRL